jgi:hypothetical protein
MVADLKCAPGKVTQCMNFVKGVADPYRAR